MTMEFDMSAFMRSLDATQQRVIDAIESGMGDAVDALIKDSRDLAPLEFGTLRESAYGTVETEGTQVIGEVTYSVTEQGEGEGGNRGNYALYQHELAPYDNPTTPGTGPKYLERPLKQNHDKYMKLVADAVREELS